MIGDYLINICAEFSVQYEKSHGCFLRLDMWFNGKCLDRLNILFVNAGDEGNNVEKTFLCTETAFGSSLLFTGSDAPKDK